MPNGLSVAYRGTDISNASDYSRSIDSRWKFLEVAFEDQITINLPAIAASGDTSKGYEQKYDIVTHNLNYYPMFECSVEILAGSPLIGQSGNGQQNFWGYTSYGYPFNIYSDQNVLSLFPTYQASTGQAAVTLLVKYRVYTLNISEEYQAPAVAMPNANAGNNPTGIKILDGTQPLSITDKSPEGFSLDTTMKTLAVHSVHTQFIDNTNNKVDHTVGYPPTYFIMFAPFQPFTKYFSGYNIPYRANTYSGQIYEPLVRITATNNYLQFRGVQSVFTGTFVFVILKDPAEIAQ